MAPLRLVLGPGPLPLREVGVAVVGQSYNHVMHTL